MMRRNSSKSHLFKKIPQAKTCYLSISPSLFYLLKHLQFSYCGVFHALFSYLRRSSPDHFTDPFRRLWLFSIAFEVKIEILSVAQKTVCNLILSCLCCSFSPPVFKLQHPWHHHSTPAHYSNRNEAFVIMAREGSQRSLTSAFLVGTLAGQGRSRGALFS